MQWQVAQHYVTHTDKRGPILLPVSTPTYYKAICPPVLHHIPHVLLTCEHPRWVTTHTQGHTHTLSITLLVEASG